MWSVQTKNGVKDIEYKRHGDKAWIVMLDGKRLGFVWNMGRLGWDLIVENDAVLTVQTVSGFVNRDKAVAHLLKVLGYHWDDSPYEHEYILFKINMKYG